MKSPSQSEKDLVERLQENQESEMPPKSKAHNVFEKKHLVCWGPISTFTRHYLEREWHKTFFIY